MALTSAPPVDRISSSCPSRGTGGEAVDPVHELFGDDTLRLLSPILGCDLPPTLPELAELIEHHPIRSARPGGVLFLRMLEVVKWYCDAKDGEWRKLRRQVDSVVD